jgi:hypothetical protein
MSNTSPINIRNLVKVIRCLPPDISVLISGDHGIGKSAIAFQLGEELGLPVLDKRIATMTDGDLVGIPRDNDEVTSFIPVEFIVKASQEPVILFLDEVNRGTTELQNGSFQICGSREMNGMKMHPETRIIACVNGASTYNTNDPDAAFFDRFAIFHLDPDLEDWVAWAKGTDVDPYIIEFIESHPEHLRFKEIDKMEPYHPYPTPRSWAKFDSALKYANLSPKTLMGTDPGVVFYQMGMSLVGSAASSRFTDWVKNYEFIVTAEDVLFDFDNNVDKVTALSRPRILDLIKKIGEHGKKNDWTPEVGKNLKKLKECENFDDEVGANLFTEVAESGRIANLKVLRSIDIGLFVAEGAKKALS